MGWESIYPRNAKQSDLANHSIQVLVFDRLKPVGLVTRAEWDEQLRKNVQSTLRQPYLQNLEKCARCIGKIWGAFEETKQPRESAVEMVKALTSWVPSTGPASSADLFTMAAELAKDYVGSYRGVVDKSIQATPLSKEQHAIREMTNKNKWKPDKTLGKWAEEMLDIGEYGLLLVKPAREPQRIHQDNVDALEEYMRVVRPLLYDCQQEYPNLSLSRVI